MGSDNNFKNIDWGLARIREAFEIDGRVMELTERAARFHGHLCPGLAMGIVASSVALRDGRRSEDEELVAVVENDACGVDAIQALTGCTFGKGNLVFFDFGKTVYTFHNRTRKTSVRLSLVPGQMDSGGRERMKALMGKMRSGTISGDEEREFWENHIDRTGKTLELGDDLFKVEEVEHNPPEKARIFDSVTCQACGESTMATRVVEEDGKNLCIPCSRRGG